MSNEFLNHGLGFMRQSEHNRLISLKAINCHGDWDAIVAEYPKLIATKNNGDKESYDLGGDLTQLRLEAEKIKKEKGWESKIEYFPRAYSLFLEKEKLENSSKFMEKQAINSL